MQDDYLFHNTGFVRISYLIHNLFDQKRAHRQIGTTKKTFISNFDNVQL